MASTHRNAHRVLDRLAARRSRARGQRSLAAALSRASTPSARAELESLR